MDLTNLILLFLNFNLVNGYIRACYFTNWAHYRQGRAKYTPEDYIPGLCTHILFAFGVMDNQYVAKAFDPEDLPTGEGMYKRINALKAKDPNLKTLLSFGGYNFGTPLFQKMSSTAKNRAKFIKSVIKFVHKYEFDGIDIDWEYPTNGDKKNYIKFFKELRKAVGKKLLITAAVSANSEKVDDGYDVPSMSKLLDFVMIMTYDFHGTWEQKTGMNSPLFATKNDANPNFNVESATEHWVKRGLTPKKLVVGLATYGHSWTLSNPKKDRGMGASGTAGTATEFVKTGGTVAYFEICEMLAKGAKAKFDNETQTPYLVKGNQWFSYDNAKSIKIKANWIKKKEYGGAFFWTLDFDDFNAKCPLTKQRYPLISTVANILGGGNIANEIPKGEEISNNKVESSKEEEAESENELDNNDEDENKLDSDESSIEKPDVSTNELPKKSPKKDKNKEFSCTEDGFFADPKSCSHFYRCISGTAHYFDCSDGLQFNEAISVCDYPEAVNCTD